jgi:hypothetical protein
VLGIVALGLLFARRPAERWATRGAGVEEEPGHEGQGGHASRQLQGGWRQPHAGGVTAGQLPLQRQPAPSVPGSPEKERDHHGEDRHHGGGHREEQASISRRAAQADEEAEGTEEGHGRKAQVDGDQPEDGGEGGGQGGRPDAAGRFRGGLRYPGQIRREQQAEDEHQPGVGSQAEHVARQEETGEKQPPQTVRPPQDTGKSQGEDRVHAEPEDEGEEEVVSQVGRTQNPSQRTVGEGDVSARQAAGEGQRIDRIGPGRIEAAAQRAANVGEQEKDGHEPGRRDG